MITRNGKRFDGYVRDRSHPISMQLYLRYIYAHAVIIVPLSPVILYGLQSKHMLMSAALETS